MTKKELEIRVEILETTLREIKYYISEENREDIRKKESISRYGDEIYYILGQIDARVDFVEKRINDFQIHGEDIYKKH